VEIDQLLTHFQVVQPNGTGFKARCPAHDDHNPSLHISVGEESRILIYDHAGCELEDILQAAGLEMSDLYNDNGRPVQFERPTVQPKPEPEPIDSAVIARMHQGLSEQARECLKVERMLTDEVVDHYKIGFEERDGERRITLPIVDGQGNYRDIRRWLHPKSRAEGKQKMLHWRTGYGATRLFPIDQLQADELVICEGELDALALIAQGIPAITATCGASTWPDSLSERFKDKQVTVLMDDDRAGEEGAKKRAGSLAQHGIAAKIAQWPEDRPDSWDVTDELREHGVSSLRQILEGAEVWTVGVDMTDVEERDDDREETEQVEQFDLRLSPAVWRGVVADYRDMLECTTEAPDAYHLFTFLTCVGSLIGRRAYINYAGFPLYANLYTAIVGPTGEGRKTTSLRHAERAVKNVDGSWQILKGISSAEGLLAQLADPWANERGNGGVPDQGGTGDKRLLLCLSELSTLLKKAQQKGVSNIVPLLTECFDCPSELHLPTRNDPLVVTAPYVSLIAASTPSWLEDLQDRDILGGFGNRFIYILGQKKKPIPFPDPPNNDLGQKVEAHLCDMLAWLPDEMEVELHESAKHLWRDFYTRWRSLAWSDEVVAAIVQRIPDITLKIALIYALLEKQSVITEEILSAAIEAGGYAVASAQRIFSEFHTSRSSTLEKRVVDVLAKGPQKYGDLHRAVGGRYSTQELQPVLEALKKAGILDKVDREHTVVWKLV